MDNMLNKEYVVDILRYDDKGRGISKINGIIAFVNGAILDEKILVKVVGVKKNFLVCNIISIIKASHDRIVPKCPYYEMCGGCNLMHLNYSKTHEIKKEIVFNKLSKNINLNMNQINDVFFCSQYNYRNKIKLHIFDGKIGLYSKGSNSVVDIKKCLIASNLINKIIDIIRKENLFFNANEIIIKTSKFNSEAMIIFDFNNDKFNVIKVLTVLKGYSFVKSIVFKNKNQINLIKGSKIICERLGEYNYQISPFSFFQVNSDIAYNMYLKVKEYVGYSNNVVDLYCGSGTISLFLSKNSKNVYGIELVKDSIIDAKKNAIFNKVSNCKFIKGDVKNLVCDFKNKRIDAVVVDPPRKGLDKKTIRTLLDFMCSKLIYVSCDLNTLARDLKLLSLKYEVFEVSLYDMFPNTSHIETIVYLKLKKS